MARRSRVRESRTQIEVEIQREILRQAEARAEVESGTQEFAEKVRDHWKFVEAPVDSGEYAASIKVRKPRSGKGLPTRQVVATDWKAHLIEFGTGPDEEGSQSPFGPDTPTPAFAPAQKTATRFGGDLTGGVG